MEERMSIKYIILMTSFVNNPIVERRVLNDKA